MCGCGWRWRRTARRVAVAWLRGCVYGCGWCWGWTARRVAVAWLRGCVYGCGWCWGWTARRVAVAWLRGCVYGCGWCWGGQRGVFVVAWLRIFLFFACGGVGVTCIVEYWDALHRVFYRIFWKRNDDFLDLCRYSGLCGWWLMYYSGFIGLGNCYRLFLLAVQDSYLICIL